MKPGVYSLPESRHLHGIFLSFQRDAYMIIIFEKLIFFTIMWINDILMKYFMQHTFCLLFWK